MSNICENCGLHFHGAFTPGEPIVRKEAATGYVYKFCSEECANLWFGKRKKSPHPPLSSLEKSNSHKAKILFEETRREDSRLQADGESDRQA